MKVLFDHPNPFLLAHGGFQIQIEQTKKALIEVGEEVANLCWWDKTQSADIIHYFGRPSGDYIAFAHKKGIRVVMSELLTGPGSRSAAERGIQKVVMQLAQTFLPSAFTSRMGWESYKTADAVIAGTSWEAQLMRELFDAPAGKLHIVPNGVEQIFFRNAPQSRSPWLVCTATITERKRILELAQAAVQARTPLWIIGAPYSENDRYFQEFKSLAQSQPELIRYEGSITERSQLAEIYNQARGFVLLSTMESRSLSTEEAAACSCPLLLSDLPWAHSCFGTAAHYCPLSSSTAITAKHLTAFYDIAPSLPAPPKPRTWPQIAAQLQEIYSGLPKTSR